MSAQEVTWNLTELFPSITSPRIEEAISQATAEADKFEQNTAEK